MRCRNTGGWLLAIGSAVYAEHPVIWGGFAALAPTSFAEAPGGRRGKLGGAAVFDYLVDQRCRFATHASVQHLVPCDWGVLRLHPRSILAGGSG